MRLHPIAATNLMQSCYGIFKREAAACGVDAKENFANLSDDNCAKLINVSRDRPICFQMSSKGHVCIVSTVHAFKRFVCP